MSNLKLGPLPKLGIVRMTVPMPEPLKEELDLYAAEYGRQYGEVDTATLIPHMLEACHTVLEATGKRQTS